jgi:hypothetical protein
MPLGNYSQKEIVLTGRKRLERSILCLVALGTAAFAWVDSNVLYFGISLLAVGVNWIAVRANKEVYLSRGVVNVAVLAATALTVMEFIHGGQKVLVVLGHFLVLIQLCKLFEKKGSRDLMHLIVLNVLLMVMAAMLTTSLWFALVIVVYALLASFVGMTFVLNRGLESVASVVLASETEPMAPKKVAWNVLRHWPTRSLRRRIWGILPPMILLAVGSYLFMPRLSVAMEQASGASGGHLDSRIRLGRPRQAYVSDDPIMTVQILQDGQPQEATVAGSTYLRTHRLDRYAYSMWRAAEQDPKRHDEGRSRGGTRRKNQPGFLLKSETDEAEKEAPVSAMEPTLQHRITFQVPTLTAMPTPYLTLHMDGVTGRQAVKDDRLVHRLDHACPAGQLLAYTAHSIPPPWTDAQRKALQQRCPPPTDAFPQNAVRMEPTDREQILRLARRWCSDLLDRRQNHPEQREDLNYAIAQRLTRRLRQEYTYTLDLRDAEPARDAIVDFLFHMRRGHCEYFASSLAVMLNLLDIPARVAVGYRLGEYDLSTQRYNVLARDAHAWCEVYTEKTHWRIFDPTAASESPTPTQTSLWARIGAWLHPSPSNWERQVAKYNAEQQMRLFASMQTMGHQWVAQIQDKIRAANAWVRSILPSWEAGTLVLLGWIAGAVATGFGLIWLVLRGGGGRRSSSRCLLLPLRTLIRQLSLKGVRREATETLDQWSVRARVHFDLPAAPLAELLSLHNRWRWGGKPPTTAELGNARRQARALWQHARKKNTKGQSAVSKD